MLLNLEERDINLNKKIASLLERLSQLIRALQWEIGKKKNLTPLQIQILQFLKNRKKEEIYLGKIARELGVSKGTLSESFKVLKSKNLLKGNLNLKDKRFVNPSLTPYGKKVVDELDSIQNIFSNYIFKFKEKDKKTVAKFLAKILAFLYFDGYISYARLCFTCQNFKKISLKDENFFCSLLGKKMKTYEIKLECQFHKPIIPKEGGVNIC